MNKTLLQELKDLTGSKEGQPSVDKTLKFLSFIRSPDLYPNPLPACKSRAWKQAADYYGENWGTWGYDASIRWGVNKNLISMDKNNIIRPVFTQ